MASIDRYRPPAREGYQPPVMASSSNSSSARGADRQTPLRSPTKRPRDVPPAVPSPPTHSSSRTSPPPSSSQQSRRGGGTGGGGGSAPTPARTTAPGTPAAARSQWLFTHDEVVSSPSVMDGLSPAEERLRRAKGVNFIYQSGILLDLPQITLYVAGVFFHRFYMRCSMVESSGGTHHYNIAATALFLANKTEENCRKTKDIIIAVARVAQKNSKLIIDEQSKEYWRWRDSILMYEEVMLENLTFDVMVENPHAKLYKFLERTGVIHNKNIRHAAWAFCNDSCISALPLLMDASHIAIASIFFSSTFTREPIEDIEGVPWWTYLQCDEALVCKAIEVARQLYVENPLRKPDNPYEGSPEFNLENTRKTGEGSSTNVTPRTDRDTLSPPKAATTGNSGPGVATTDTKEPSEGESKALDEAASQAPGDSDLALKEAANDPSTHPANEQQDNGILTPGRKRQEVESLSEEVREQKRRKMDVDDDEGKAEVDADRTKMDVDDDEGEVAE